MLKQLTAQLLSRTPLDGGQVALAVAELVDEKIAPETKADFLGALARKGETPEEIAAFARELRERALPVPLDTETRSREILDVVGTGGDRLGTFNISTTVAIVCAAAGVTVAKHGNRAVTSQCGSTDVLEALGVRIDLSPEQAAQSLREHGFAFFFAQKFHPAFKHVGPARKLCAERGQRTIFNFLGPLLNPARPTAQLVGVPQPALCEPLARVLQSLGVRRGMVVCGGIANCQSPIANLKDPASQQTQVAGLPAIGNWKLEIGNLDELSTLGDNTIAEFYQERGFATSVLSPENFPLQPAALDDLRGGDGAANAEIVRRILRGEERGPKRDVVLLNTAAALFVAGKARSLSDGWDMAAGVIDSGQANAKLAELCSRSF